MEWTGLHDVTCVANTYSNQGWNLAHNKKGHRLPPLQTTPHVNVSVPVTVTYQPILYTLLTYLNRPLERACSQKRQKHPNRQRCTERAMRIQSMVTNGDSTAHGSKVEKRHIQQRTDSPHGSCLPQHNGEPKRLAHNLCWGEVPDS